MAAKEETLRNRSCAAPPIPRRGWPRIAHAPAAATAARSAALCVLCGLLRCSGASRYAPPVADVDEQKKPEDLPFEEALGRLEGLIDRVESGEASLEDALADYAAGTELIKRCRAVLDTAETRMAELVRGPDGGVRTEEAGA